MSGGGGGGALGRMRRRSTFSFNEKILGLAILLITAVPFILHQHIVHDEVHHHPYHRPPQTSKVVNRNFGSAKSGGHVRYSIDGEYTYDGDLPADIGETGRTLLLSALQKRPVWDQELVPDLEKERCDRYFVYQNYDSNTTTYKGRKRRRVFMGSLIADDSWHTLATIAMETYGIYTAVAFVESNRTQTGIPRKSRFVEGTLDHKLLVESNLFGPETEVLIEHFSHEEKVEGMGLIREHMQRDRILKLWKKAGMTPDDVGILTDADETVSRDFLRAVQSCDFPQFDAETENCDTPKVAVASMVFEGSPECMTVTRKWMHPDIILGKCIEGIGDDSFKLTDDERHRPFAWRKPKFTKNKGNYSGWPKEKTTYPLWNAADFRRDQGGFKFIFEDVSYLRFRMGHTGFHFHNFFDTTQQLRNKYRTYGHPVPKANNMTISEIHPDLDLFVDCVLNRNATSNKHKTLTTRLEEFEGRIPIAYTIDGYSLARHKEMGQILLEDELGHDKSWHDNPVSPVGKKNSVPLDEKGK
ncbi:beta-1,4-mannosyl-glycoprotein 4-beta-N-acetylglucosaminyltransferase [Skeletonema marinoi]|uniref:Beta-1,4-mannosyl-glycoprotein 4-beta-N-acetylglucosaminyltransferase n=1 Tax=Skeletonema marinoi TaxID=267567 RepID=A0AAD9DJI0_9STRA|nr:beta-1,4-mannosyl-glycoprotein 4-beta-N-acetylglucosaminyltransferase [Skeletonema marinoi]